VTERVFGTRSACRLRENVTKASLVVVVLLVSGACALAAPSPASADAVGEQLAAAVRSGPGVTRSLSENTALEAIADDVVGANDLVVTVEDDPVEWASLVGSDSEDVLGFVIFEQPPSALYHAIFLGPDTAQAWRRWAASGTPAGDEYDFAVAVMALVHESFHWRLMSGDESSVNACALKYFPYYLERDFAVPQTLTRTTSEQVPVTTAVRVPTQKVVVKKVRTKVRGRWESQVVRRRVTVYVTRTTTTYETETATTTTPNPLYQTIVDNSVDFYDHQPPPYDSGTCPV
jgi:hypothetical protein